MWNLYETVALDHDARFVALAVAVCVLGSATGVAIAQRALKSQALPSRRSWLILAGLVTGLAVWTTHFTAMLGYRNDLDVRFDLTITFVSVLLSIPIAIAGWLVGFLKQERGVLAGVLIGLSIAVAHFIDMQAMQIAGTVHHNHQTGFLAIAAGAGFGGLAGHLFVRSRRQVFAWPAAITLFAAIVSLHFIAMAGVTVVPDGTMLQARPFTATPNQLSTAVVVAFLGSGPIKGFRYAA